MNNSMEDIKKPNLAYALAYGSITVLGLPLNAVSLWILLRNQNLKGANAVFMVNLAISDLLLVISLPMRIYFHATGTWPLNRMACILVTRFFQMNIKSSAFFITLISVDRLLAVVYPLRSRHLRTASNAWKTVALIWLMCITVSIPQAINFSKRLQRFNGSTCFVPPWDMQQNAYQTVMRYIVSVIMCILLAVNIVCTALVSHTLRRRLSDSARINNKMNVILIFTLNLVMFLICFLPVTVGLLIKTPNIVSLICLACVNCCLDPLLYYFSFDAFWKKEQDVDLARQ